jgi:GxxExxY protein
MEKNDLTYRINGCAMTAHRKLGRGFREYVYCRALAIELGYENILFEREVWMPIYYDNYKIAARRVDFLCQKLVTVEVKAKSQLTNEDMSQAINTLERLNVKSGLLLNFGSLALEYHHLFNNKYNPNMISKEITPELVGEPSNELWELRNYIPDWVINKMQYDKLKKKTGIRE